MTIQEYEDAIALNRFDEFPRVVMAGMTLLESFVDFEKAELELKIRLTTVVLNRNFSSLDGTMVLTDQYWLINNFLKTYERDHVRPWLTMTIREAMNMIVDDNGVFGKNAIGTTFMFGIVEFYVKYLLGWRPLDADFFDSNYHDNYRNMFLRDGINKLKRTDLKIARYLNKVDKLAVQRARERGIKEGNWIIPQMADRLAFYRNSMLHGENHSNRSVGVYLCVLYILLHLSDTTCVD